MNNQASPPKSASPIPNWTKRIGGEKDPNNREIEAYLFGKEDGKKEEVEKTDELFHTNLELCCYYSSKFYEFLTNENKISCHLATIKPEDLDRFQSLFVIDFENYKNKDLRGRLYDRANEFRNALKVKDICFEIILMSKNSDFDIMALKNDGYVLEYNNKGKERNI